ncbi:hypothetical protein FACS1894113_3240 [Alphaproteobacteria bacterium]|nr:hypothetical protein FACS1894113_3240 [Alphaproteobacteria bacterium]
MLGWCCVVTSRASKLNKHVALDFDQDELLNVLSSGALDQNNLGSSVMGAAYFALLVMHYAAYVPDGKLDRRLLDEAV